MQRIALITGCETTSCGRKRDYGAERTATGKIAGGSRFHATLYPTDNPRFFPIRAHKRLCFPTGLNTKSIASDDI